MGKDKRIEKAKETYGIVVEDCRNARCMADVRDFRGAIDFLVRANDSLFDLRRYVEQYEGGKPIPRTLSPLKIYLRQAEDTFQAINTYVEERESAIRE